MCFDFYIISLKSDIKGSVNYGRNTYDFEHRNESFLEIHENPDKTENPEILRKSDHGHRILAYASAVKNTMRFLAAPLGQAWFL